MIGREWYFFFPCLSVYLMATKLKEIRVPSLLCLLTETLNVFTAGELSLSLDIYMHSKLP